MTLVKPIGVVSIQDFNSKLSRFDCDIIEIIEIIEIWNSKVLD